MIRIQTKLLEERPPEATIREWRTIGRESHAEMGAYWHKHFLPLHFEMGANVRQKYKHKPRSGAYLKQKRRLAERGKVKKAGLVDNVFSGDMETLLKTLATIRGFPSRVTITMYGPRYITMRPHESNQPDKAAEITTVTAAEQKKLASVLGKAVTVRLRKLKKPKTTKNSG